MTEAAGELVVWLAGVPSDPDEVAAVVGDLGEQDRVRALRYVRPADRARSAVASELRLRVAATQLGVTPSALSLDRSCLLCGDPDHGKPRILLDGRPAPLDLGTSHAGDLVAVAVGGPDAGVGVDVESASRDVDWPRLARTVFSPQEWAATGSEPDPDRARWVGWTRKEAVLKASGHGLAAGLSSVRVTPLDGGTSRSAPDPAGWLGAVLVVEKVAVRGFCADLAVPAGYVGAVVTLGPTPPRLVTRWDVRYGRPGGGAGTGDS